MGTALADVHIEAQRRIRALTVAQTRRVWTALPGYDEEHVEQWLEQIIPVIGASQRAAVGLTEAFIARSIGRAPAGIDRDRIIGANVRAGVEPATVYRRPFVTVWSALGAGKTWDAAVSAGMARATATAAMDVQLAMRQTLTEVGAADDRIIGYERVPDGGACDFCVLIAGQRYRSDQLMPVHNHCGCGVDVITADRRDDFTGNRDNDLSVTRDGVTADVREHGELGPVLVNGDHDFTEL